MPVTLSSIAASSLNGSQPSRQAGVDRVTLAYQKADRRIQQQRDLATVQLSSAGRLKSAFAEAQNASIRLADIKPISNDAEVRKAADSFVKAFNSAVQTARSTANQTGAPAEINRVRAAEAELRRSVSDEGGQADLRMIGITQLANGTLTIDTKRFDTALSREPDSIRSALPGIGLQVSQTAGAQLADGGYIGKAVNALGNRVRNLETRQAEQQALATAGQQTVSTQTKRFTADLNSGAAAYERIFST